MLFSTMLILIAVVCTFICWMCFNSLKISKDPQEKIAVLTVVVPFKNEEERLPFLIDSINSQSIPQKMTVHFLFVDDRSTDHGIMEIEKLKYSFEIITNNGSGKKAAIHQGVLRANSEYMLTLDADVILPPGYFQLLHKRGGSDLMILPVNMKGTSIIGSWSCIEFDYLQMITFGLARLSKPILCNGANLFFRKQLYLDACRMRDDFNLASGDDYFLLQAAKRLGAKITSSNHSDLQVKTPAPANFSSLLNQRKRWVSKIDYRLDEVLGGLVVLFYQFFFLMVVGLSWLNPALLILAGSKLIFEWIILSVYRKEVYSLSAVFLNQLISPFYYTALLTHKVDEPKWHLEKE